jgi:hypothetical protein
MREHLESLSGLVSAILFAASLAFIFAGIRLVYLGTAERATIEILGHTLPAGLVGKTSLAIGALGLMLIVRSVVRGIRDMFSMPHGRTGR